jgi:hypothetical protein
MLHICFTTNQRWLRQTQRAIYDIIIRKNQDTEITFYILFDTEDFSDSFTPFKDIPGITIVTKTIDTQLEFNYKIIPYIYEWVGQFKHLKFLIPELDIFEGVDKVLYVDVDMLARKDLTSLYNYDLENYAIGAVRDYSHLRMPNYMDIFRTCNKIENGLLLMNLRKLRKLNFTERCKAETGRFVGDLGVLEAVAFPYTKLLDPKCQIPYHFMCAEPVFREIERWNEYTGAEYETILDLVRESYFWHYCGDKTDFYAHNPHVKTSFDLSEERLAEFLKTGTVMDWKPSDDDILTIDTTTGEEYV